MSDMLVILFLSFAVAMLTFVLVLVCLSLYEIFEEPGVEKRMRQLRASSQPWVTVLLYARNCEKTIQESLNALVKNNYRNFDIVVINDRSKDDTRGQAQHYIDNHPGQNTTLFNRQKVSSLKQSLEAGYKKSKRGEVVITLWGDAIVSKGFIKRAVATKNDNQKIVMRINEPVLTTTLNEIIQSMKNFLWLSAQTVYVTDSKHIHSPKLKVRPDFIAVVIFVGILFVSILTQEAIIIWYSWVIVTGYLCAVILISSEGLKTKITLTFSALSALFLLPVSSIIQVFSQFGSRK